ncbi:MAG: ribosome small subunit-dependent GTPase A [Ruminococcaceae bacterium]|nr:ribosome small subunit-dependent GTPase A [Oscillospiraceae bacterium]
MAYREKKSIDKISHEEALTGRILSCVGGIYSVISGDVVYNCSAKGSFRHNDIVPVAGDTVSFIPGKDRGFIISVNERKNLMPRPPVANIDILFIVCAAASPEPSKLSIDKLSVIAYHHDIEPILIINKAELDKNSAEDLKDTYSSCGHKVFSFSIDEHPKAASVILPEATGKICAFAGLSGVGKTTLMNSIFGNDFLKTGELSLRLRRGKNTTRDSVLYKIPVSEYIDEDSETFLADTPGFSLLDFEKFFLISKEELPYAFMEFNEHIGSCKYTKCTHTVEEGCAIIKAVNDGLIPRSRHESYVYLFNCVKNHNKWDKKFGY